VSDSFGCTRRLLRAMNSRVKVMPRLFRWYLSVLLLSAATAAGAQVPDSGQTPTTPPPTKPEVIITAPTVEQPLPKLRPDNFSNCLQQSPGGSDPSNIDYLQAEICEQQLNYEKRVVVLACINKDGTNEPSRVIQACTEALDKKIFEGHETFFLFADRADAYFALGDKQHALEDYDEAAKLAPRNAKVYYNRGVFHAAQSDDDGALQDFDTALSIDPKLVAALRQRAKIYHARSNFSSALADYSEAIRLEPKTAELWSERGYVCLRQKDLQGAVRDEAQAIQLDPKLARAYFIRGRALADLGDRANAVNDIRSAVGLDSSLARYVIIKDKTATLSLPPL
jgi:tetratricopeptide (TPR) repeat protein